MKILYLLFAVFLLVLQGAPEFCQAQHPFLPCRLQGGECYYLRCPFNAKAIGSCSIRHLCCQR
ncbi:gallinacin-1 alpha-like [Carettochelys insculpta]|uniref:gallinacin-1 alpha-like n=1 Tax=Carettochelys insculpta TaxID=44489 RepID=UPI003EBE5816